MFHMYSVRPFPGGFGPRTLKWTSLIETPQNFRNVFVVPILPSSVITLCGFTLSHKIMWSLSTTWEYEIQERLIKELCLDY